VGKACSSGNPFAVCVNNELIEWVFDPEDSPFAFLLGEPGAGKTWASLILASDLVKRIDNKEHGVPVPIIFDMGMAVASKHNLFGESVPSLEDFLETISFNSKNVGEKPWTSREIIEAVQEHGSLLILDGLDKLLAHQKDGSWGRELVRRICGVLPLGSWHPNSKKTGKKGKVLLTCRTNFFKSAYQQRDWLFSEQMENIRGWETKLFNEKQIADLIELSLENKDAKKMFGVIESIDGLADIASRPGLLRLLVNYHAPKGTWLPWQREGSSPD